MIGLKINMMYHLPLLNFGYLLNSFFITLLFMHWDQYLPFTFMASIGFLVDSYLTICELWEST